MRSFHLIVFLISLFCSIPGYAQDPDAGVVDELYQSFLDSYGPDQNLINGIRFYNLHAYYAGHKFFGEDMFVKGRLVLDRGTYPDVYLKYDLYGQQLILQANYTDGSYNEIIVSDSRLRGFELESKTFRKLYFPETDTLIFQVIGNGDPGCLYHWIKEIIPNSTGPQSVYEFSKMKRKSYVLTNSTMREYKGARSFSKSFPDYRPQVMSYIRQEKIKLRKAGDSEMEGLLNYCSTLLIEGGNR